QDAPGARGGVPPGACVLSDAEASRRHAVIEAGPQGLAIRDTGSANGVYVNSKKVERASLQPGDLVRIGEVIIKILAEEITGTVVMPPEELEARGSASPPAAAGAAPAASNPKAPAPRAAPPPRPAPAHPPGPRPGRAPAQVAAGAPTDGARPAPGRPPPRPG